MGRKVIITGNYAPYTGPFRGYEIWGCNTNFRKQPQMSRLYVMDDLAFFRDPEVAYKKIDPRYDYVDEVNNLGIPVVMREKHPDIPLSERFPMEEFEQNAHVYFTSSIAYMMADCLRLAGEIDEVIVHRILVLPPSGEYIDQKGCLDFWLGALLGRGVAVRVSEDSNIGRPLPWQTAKYGYELESSDKATKIMWDAAIAAFRARVEIVSAEEAIARRRADYPNRVKAEEDAAEVVSPLQIIPDPGERVVPRTYQGNGKLVQELNTP